MIESDDHHLLLLHKIRAFESSLRAFMSSERAGLPTPRSGTQKDNGHDTWQLMASIGAGGPFLMMMTMMMIYWIAPIREVAPCQSIKVGSGQVRSTCTGELYAIAKLLQMLCM